MPARFQHRPDRRSGPLLATTLVLFLGAIGVAVVIAASGGNPYYGLLVFVAFPVVAFLLGILFRAAPERTLSTLYGWMKSREVHPAEQYKPRAARVQREYGNNRPPSAEELRDLKGGLNNWVPSNVPPSSKKPKKSGPSS